MSREEQISPDAVLINGTSGHLVVMFGSWASLFTQTFECYDFFASRPDDTLIFRDHTQTSFHRGFRGLTDNFEENIAFLKEVIRRKSPERTTFMGISSGAHAAIVHGAIVGVDDVIAINPVSTFDSEVAAQHGIGQRVRSNFDEMELVYPTDHPQRYLLDARKVMEDNPDGIGLVGVHYGSNDHLDSLNAQYLMSLPDVESIPHPHGHHSMLGMQLIEQGVLTYHLDTPLEPLREQYRTYSNAEQVRSRSA